MLRGTVLNHRDEEVSRVMAREAACRLGPRKVYAVVAVLLRTAIPACRSAPAQYALSDGAHARPVRRPNRQME